jgi:glutamyl-tRNA reductase
LNISMAGIDHNKAPLKVREKFSFTKLRKAEILRQIQVTLHPGGCVLIHTCNRTELWLSGKCPHKPYEILCRAAGVDPKTYSAYFVSRSGKRAVRHLFMLAGGLKSMIFAEDQILSQVKDSLAFAREQECTDAILNKLFSMAITAAKKVKTDLVLGNANPSAAKLGVEKLCEQFGDLSRLNCLVIGNGEMGRLVARRLVERESIVCMTLRQYTKGQVVIPEGCACISYDDRYAYLQNADAVVSATTSPHYTLKKDPFPKDGKPRILIDLAVPRDIEPEIGQLPGTVLFDVDDLRAEPDPDSTAVSEAMAILDEYIEKLMDWYYFRDLAPRIDEISRMTAQDAISRASFAFKAVKMDDVSRELLERLVLDASKNAVSSLLYGLKEGLSWENVQDCMEGLKVSALKQKGALK